MWNPGHTVTQARLCCAAGPPGGAWWTQQWRERGKEGRRRASRAASTTATASRSPGPLRRRRARDGRVARRAQPWFACLERLNQHSSRHSLNSLILLPGISPHSSLYAAWVLVIMLTQRKIAPRASAARAPCALGPARVRLAEAGAHQARRVTLVLAGTRRRNLAVRVRSVAVARLRMPGDAFTRTRLVFLARPS